MSEGDLTPDFDEVKISFRAARERVCNVLLHMTHSALVYLSVILCVSRHWEA